MWYGKIPEKYGFVLGVTMGHVFVIYARYSCEFQSPVDTERRLLTAIKKYL